MAVVYSYLLSWLLHGVRYWMLPVPIGCGNVSVAIAGERESRTELQ